MRMLQLFALVFAVAATPCIAQQGSPGTAGASNAAAASPGGIPPSTPGTAAGSTNPGQINGAPQASQPAQPTLNPNQAPNTAAATVNSTTPTPAPAMSAVGGSRVERGTVGSNAPQQSQRDMDKALDDSEKQNVKSICKGC